MLVLIRKCGILVGPTTGAVYHGMIKYLKTKNPESLQRKKVVFIACDRFEPYTSYIKEKRPEIFGDKNNKTKTNILGEINIINTIPSDISDVIIIDMRSYESYKIGHIHGSISFPFGEMQKYIQEEYLPFPKEKKLIFVCPFGEESILMSQISNGIGYKSYSLKNGYLDYRKMNSENITSQS